jgi:hypothetical protein
MGYLSLADRRVAFAVAGRRFDWRDLMVAARAWRKWDQVEQEAGSTFLLLEHARSTGQALTGPQFEAEAHRFRYARHLISADDLERWLAERGLDVEQWLDYVRGAVLARLPAAAGPAPAHGAALPSVVRTHAVCSGALERVATRLASRAAVTFAQRGSLPDGPLTEPQIRALDKCFDDFRCRCASGSAVVRALDRHREDWTRVDVRWLTTPDQNVAREMALCVRVDGRSFTNVAEDAGLPLTRRERALEQFDASLRASILGAGCGQLVGPLTVNGERWLLEVLDRRAPTLEQPEVAARARRAAIGHAVEGEVAEHVRWHDRP